MPENGGGSKRPDGGNNDPGQNSKYNYVLSIMFSIAAQDRPADERSTEIPGLKQVFVKCLLDEGRIRS